MAAVLNMLPYGEAADALDEYLQLSEDSVLLSTKAFWEDVIIFFGLEYLWEPTKEILVKILKLNAARGFPECVGSIVCHHWEWKNCPITLAGQYMGKEK